MDEAGGLCHIYPIKVDITCRIYGWETDKPENAIIVLDFESGVLVGFDESSGKCNCGLTLSAYLDEIILPINSQITVNW